MTTAYLLKSGIEPWEEVDGILVDGFFTVTLLASTAQEIFPIWLRVANSLSIVLPWIVRWHTVGYSLQTSKTQEYLLQRRVAPELGANDVMEKNPETGIFSSVQDVSATFGRLDLLHLAQPTRSVLVFLPHQVGNMRQLWQSLKIADKNLKAPEILEFLRSWGGAILCSVVASDTHAAVQFIGCNEQEATVVSALSVLSIRRISDQDVPAFINSN